MNEAFGDSLRSAADRLIDSGGVLEVRVLQGGNVITGIVGGDGADSPGSSSGLSPGSSPGSKVATQGAAANAQTGAVVTKVGAKADVKASAKFRVYIRGAQRECSCGGRGVCVHVAAVSIVAARKGTGAGTSGALPLVGTQGFGNTGMGVAGLGATGVGTAALGAQGLAAPGLIGQSAPAQQLCYLLTMTAGASVDAHPAGREPPRVEGPAAGPKSGTIPLAFGMAPAGHLGGIRVSVWVAQRGAVVGSIVPGSACAFALRRASIASAFEFPRYVDQSDREILPVLPEGDVGADVLMRIVSTGRAHLSTLERTPLRVGPSRGVTLVWKVLGSGEQVLGWESVDLTSAAPTSEVPAGAAVDVLLGLDPPLYVDSQSGAVGSVELACDVAFAREMGLLGAVAPEFVNEVNERIERVCGGRPDTFSSGGRAGGITFPRLRGFAPAPESLRSVTPRLVLAADEQALLYFVYNDKPVDSRSLSDGHNIVRVMDGAALYEIPRNLATETSFRSQLGEVTSGRAAWLEFMMKRVPALEALGWSVEVEPGFPYRLVTAGQWYGDLGADQRQAAWFNLRLGVIVDGQPVNLLPALTRYLTSSLEGDTDKDGCRVGEHWLVRLADGRYLPIEIERIQRIANTLVELLERDGLNDAQGLSLPRSQSGRLAQLTVDLNSPVLSSQDTSLAELIEDLRSFSGIQALQPPSSFNGTLRHYQQEGLGWLQFLRRFRLGGILADDMGLGKTVQTIAHILMEVESGRLQKPVLIVAPVSALGNWKQELTRFAPSLSVFTWHGAQRRKSTYRLEDMQVIITAYPLLLIDSEILMGREFGLVILDEAQMIKNPGSKVSQMARALRADSRLCLSGTPVENHLGELWSLFDFLQPGLLGDERHFQRQYRTPIEKNGDRARAAALSARLAPFLLRRTKDAVAKELPPKVEIIESITLDDKQRDFYDGVRLAMHQRILEVVREQGLARSQITILDALLKLRQVCCDPRLVKTRGTGVVPSAKMEWLCTVLPELIAEGRRILLFSQFTSMLRLIEAAVTALGIPYCLLTGETTDRAAVVQRFQAGETPLFLISLKAGGTALNLTAADTVIHYDPWWNPAVEAQATDRAHRIGQTKSVFVYKLIAQDTVEERMLQLQADKRVLADHLYTQKSASPTALGVEDLEMLLAP